MAFLMLVFHLFIKAPIPSTIFKEFNNNAARTTPTLNEPFARGGAENVYNGAGILIATSVCDDIMNSSFFSTGINSVASRLAVKIEFIIPTAIGNGNSTANGATSSTT